MKQKKVNLVLGTAQLGVQYGISGRPLVDDPSRILDFARKSEIEMIDTAQAYGQSERIIGAYLANTTSWRPKIITKIFIESENVGELLVELKVKIEQSQACLRMNQFYCLMLHNINALKKFGNNLASQLENIKTSGIASNLGVSVYTSEDFKLAMSYDMFDIFQGPVNLLDMTLPRTGLMGKAGEGGKSFFVRSIYLQGLLFLKQSELGKKVPKAKPFIDKLRGIADSCGRPLDELAFVFVRDQQAVKNIVVGIKSLKQLKRNLELLSKPALSAGVRAELARVAGDVPNQVADPRKWHSKDQE